MTRALPLPPLPPFAVLGYRRFIQPVCDALIAFGLGLLLYVVLVLTMRQIVP